MDDRIRKLAIRKINDLQNNTGLFVSLQHSMHWEETDGLVKTENNLPSTEAIKAAAMDIRHFLAPQSDLSMKKFIEFLEVNRPADKVKLRKFYEAWEVRTGEKPSRLFPVALKLNGEDLMLKRQIDLWMNGELFHTDLRKSEALGQMNVAPFRDIAWILFVSTLQDLSNLLIYFRDTFLI